MLRFFSSKILFVFFLAQNLFCDKIPDLNEYIDSNAQYFLTVIKEEGSNYDENPEAFKERLKNIFLKDSRDENDLNYTLSLIKQYEIIRECYQKANHYINLASNSLSIFKDCNERNILENLTSFSLSRDF